MLKLQKEKYDQLRTKYRDLRLEAKTTRPAAEPPVPVTVNLEKLLFGGKAALERAQKDVDARRRDELRSMMADSSEPADFHDDEIPENASCLPLRRFAQSLGRLWRKISPLVDDMRCAEICVLFPVFTCRSVCLSLFFFVFSQLLRRGTGAVSLPISDSSAG